MKINLRSIMLFGLFFSLYQCEKSFESDARLLVTGNIVNENNAPVANAEINVFSRSNEELLGHNVSRSDGSFEVISLYDKDDSFNVSIEIDDVTTTYNYVTNLETFEPEDLTIDVGIVTLIQKAILDVNINRTSGNNNTLNFTLSYLDNSCREVFIEGEIDQSQSVCYEVNSISRTLNDTRPDFDIEIPTQINSDVTFNYAVNNGTSQIQIIMLNALQNEFNFEY